MASRRLHRTLRVFFLLPFQEPRRRGRRRNGRDQRCRAGGKSTGIAQPWIRAKVLPQAGRRQFPAGCAAGGGGLGETTLSGFLDGGPTAKCKAVRPVV